MEIPLLKKDMCPVVDKFEILVLKRGQEMHTSPKQESRLKW